MVSRSESVLRWREIPGSGLTVILEDDGRVAYAYLKSNGAIVADVWLYNVAEPPERNNWRDKTQLAFSEPAKLLQGRYRRATYRTVADRLHSGSRARRNQGGRSAHRTAQTGREARM